MPKVFEAERCVVHMIDWQQQRLITSDPSGSLKVAQIAGLVAHAAEHKITMQLSDPYDHPLFNCHRSGAIG